MTEQRRQFYQSLQQNTAYLHFSDGTSFKGKINLPADSVQLQEGIWGEAAFTTGMSGYQETMTDPSFLGQHIIFTTSHVGNYPSDDRVLQSKKIHSTCLIASQFSYSEFLANSQTPLLSGVDTRALVKYLTSHPESHISVVTSHQSAPAASEFTKRKLHCEDLDRVSQNDLQTLIPGENPIVVINYGIKQAILDHLISLNLPLVSVPHNTKAEAILTLNPRLIFLSNGPGDPRLLDSYVQEVRAMLNSSTPIRGICLGHQLLGLALGGEIERLPFGQRGINHPVLERETGKILISSQNHGYSLTEESLNKLNNIIVTHRSLFDHSVEGLSTTDRLYRSVQFHPEAHPGPHDAYSFFHEIYEYLNKKPQAELSHDLEDAHDLNQPLNKEIPYKKILLIGSGPIKIGQASEFDYSGTQACKALKALGLDVILLNSNPATIMTDPEMCAQTYIEPITKESIKKIIKSENVDAVLSTMGGQTALNICIELEEENFLKENNVTLLGAKVDTIKRTEDRELFAVELDSLGYQTGKRFMANTPQEAIQLAHSKVGYPLIIRRDFALGGKGAALVYNDHDLKTVFETDIKFPITMEKSLLGWKEIELEVMVDTEKNGVIICSIENIDPCGTHTGDSITVAPAQTISDRCYQQLRTMALNVAKHMNVVAGGANVQFAINPLDEDDIVVIEMNPRVSRSSALASKATGYPIAKISALLAVGYTLKEILNDITKASPVAFEPTLDYVAVKIPTFPFNKFPSSSRELGPQMRSVGEVLALGRNFNEAFFKALRSLEIGLEIPSLKQLKTTPFDMDLDYIEKRLQSPQQLGLLTCLEAIRLGKTIDEIYDATQISSWFIEQMEHFHLQEKKIQESPEIIQNPECLREAKRQGLSDKFIAKLTNLSQKDILRLRFDHKVFPVFKAVDTCSGEFLAQTPYFYSTYDFVQESTPLYHQGRSIVIMGSGPNRIGQGIEFDYSCVKSCQYLKQKNIQSIMINSNPETVSTDYDSSDRLYMAPLYSEDLFDIFLFEKPEGIVSCFSGQTGINVRQYIEEDFRSEFATFKFLGSSLETINLAEDRNKFSELTRDIGLNHTNSIEVQGYKNLLNAMIKIGLPVIIRPSYVIGGESMYVFHNHDDIEFLPNELKEGLKNSSTLFQVENYLKDALEYDVDLIRDQHGNCIFTVCEHIEHAGVHSGDSGMIAPPVVLTQNLMDKMRDISIKLAEKLNVIGPVNIQYAVKDGKIFCIEANPRGSRTLPFLSKAFGISLPQLATEAMLGGTLKEWSIIKNKFFSVKQSTFPFDRFVKDNIILGPKMRSTGETMGIDHDKDHALMKSYLGNYPYLQEVGKILMSLGDDAKEVTLPYLKGLHKRGYRFLATIGTCEYIRRQGFECQLVDKIGDEEKGISIIEALKDSSIRLVLNTPKMSGQSKSDGEVIRNTAIQYAIPCFTRKENIVAVLQALMGTQNDLSPLSLQRAHQEMPNASSQTTSSIETEASW